ncbi:MAG: S8 family serine peptidase [Planctomycetota bacterium]
MPRTVARIFTALAVCLGAGTSPAQGSAPEPLTPYLVVLEESAHPERRRLLHEFRRRLRSAGDRDRCREILAQLARGERAAQDDLCRWLERRGARVGRRFFVIPAVEVALPADQAADLAAELRHRDGVAAVCADRSRGADIRRTTDAANHNTDYAQDALGHFGQGVVLALLDSGIDTDVDGAGNPHPAFEPRAPATGSRILSAVGIAAFGDSEDQTGHGSAVAAIALGNDWQATFGGSDLGHAPDAEVISYKVTKGSSETLRDADVVAAWQAVLWDRAVHDVLVACHSFKGSPSPTFPSQQAADTVAYFADVLVVTSAGNDGGEPIPGAESQANVNGLSVGSVLTAIGPSSVHRVVPTSTFGPLPGDGSRFFPDLVACGEGVVTVQIDAARGRTTKSGTSFAAAQVAGTALLLRAAEPQYTFLDAKAVLLNNVEDVSADNPGKSRFHYGLGMLRTDLTLDALRDGALLRGGVAAAGPTVAPLSVAAEAGKAYAATLAWPRTDPASPDWDDLDLRVIDPSGRTLAISDSPRNVYERVLFVANETGQYTLEVVGVSFTSPHAVPFAVAFGENRGGGRQLGSYERYGISCDGTAPDPAAGVVLPVFGSGVFGNSSTRVPFSYLTTRLQQAFSGATLTSPITIDRLAFRRDEQQADSPGYDLVVELLLGYTDRAPNALDPVFANNPSGAMTTVLVTDTVRFPGTQGLPASADQFDFVIPLDQPFVLAPTGNENLLLEARVYQHSEGSQPFGLVFDAIQDASVGRVYTDGQPLGTSGAVENIGLVVSFLAADDPPIAPNLQADGRPQLGDTFRVVLRHALPGSAAVLAHGVSNVTWAGVPLPFDMAPAGAPSCFLWCDSWVAVPLLVDAAGTTEFEYSVPTAPSFTGQQFYNQYWVLDPAANALGLVFTDAARALIGG